MTPDSFPIPESVVRRLAAFYAETEPDEFAMQDAREALHDTLTVWGATVEWEHRIDSIDPWTTITEEEARNRLGRMDDPEGFIGEVRQRIVFPWQEAGSDGA